MRIFTAVSFKGLWTSAQNAEIDAVGPYELLDEYIEGLLSQGWQEISPRYSMHGNAFAGLSTIRQFTRTAGDAGRYFIGIDQGRLWRSGDEAGDDTWCGHCKNAYWSRSEQIWGTFNSTPANCAHAIKEGGW